MSVQPGNQPQTPAGGPSTRQLWLMAAVVFVIAMFIRVADLSQVTSGRVSLNGLSSWPFIHDEAIHSVFALTLRDWVAGANENPRQYDPVYHGPLQYYLVALSFGVNGYFVAWGKFLGLLYGDGGWFFNEQFWRAAVQWQVDPGAATPRGYALGVTYQVFLMFWSLCGDNDFAARMPSAVFGAVMCALPLAFVRRLGLAVCLTACGLLLFCSPTHAYYSRIVLYDIMCTTVEVAAAACFFRGLTTNRLRWFWWATFFVACDLCLKPTALLWGVMLAVIGAYELFLGPDGLVRGSTAAASRLAWMGTRRGWAAFTGMFFMGLAMWVLLYTDFGRYPQHAVAINEMIGHWLSIHGEQRLTGAPWYYVAMMVVYDPLRLFLGVGAAIGLFLLHREGALRYFSLWGLLAIAVYAWAGEKGPWLINHAIVPLTFPAAWAIVAIVKWPWRGVVAGVALLRHGGEPVRTVGGALACIVLVPVGLAALGLVGVPAVYQAYSTWRLLYRQPAWDSQDLDLSVRAQKKKYEPLVRATRAWADREPFKSNLAARASATLLNPMTVILTPDKWEMMTFVATTRDFARLTENLLAVANAPRSTVPGEGWRGRVAVADAPCWPLAWYLRSSQVQPGAINFDFPKDPENYELIVVPWPAFGSFTEQDIIAKLSPTHYRLELDELPQRAWWTPRFLAQIKEITPILDQDDQQAWDRAEQAGGLAPVKWFIGRPFQGMTARSFWGQVLHRYAYDWVQLRLQAQARAKVAQPAPQPMTPEYEGAQRVSQPAELQPGVYYLMVNVWRRNGS